MDALWKTGVTAPEQYPVLMQDEKADVAVIGAGITGLTTALQLAEEGLRVVVLEARRVGCGATAGSTGNLYSILAGGLAPVRQKWGDEVVRDVVAARAGAIDYIEATVDQFSIECQFERQPLYRLMASNSQVSTDMLDAEQQAMEAAGLAVRAVSEAPLALAVEKGLVIEKQAQLNAFAYTLGLARAVTRLGGIIYENSPVRRVYEKKGEVQTDQARVRAGHIVHATHTPKGISVVQAEMVASREYGVSATLNQGSYPEGIFFVHDPFHSIRSYRRGDEQHLVIVGEKHKTGDGQQESACYDRLRAYAENTFSISGFTSRWSNQQYSPADGLPYIGRMPGHKNAYLATGFSGDGLVWGTLAGIIICDLVRQQEQPYYRHFSPSRFTPVKSAAKWAEENTTVISSLVRDYLTTGKVSELEEIGPGQGKVVSLKGEKLAVYRNAQGELAVLSAVCPHMKCLVHWNPAELSWDCPCHGSRFDLDGEVVEGPSCHPLTRHR